MPAKNAIRFFDSRSIVEQIEYDETNDFTVLFE